MYTCPLCRKSFARKHQSHQCVTVPLDIIFDRSAPHVREAFDAVLRRIEHLGSFTITTSAKAVTLYSPAGKSFLVLGPLTKLLDVWCVLDRPVEGPFIHSHRKASAHRWQIVMRITHEDEIVQEMIDLVAESYQRASTQ